MTEQTLKPGWKKVKFGDVVRLNTERVADPLASGIERYVGLEHITPEDLHIHSWGLVAEGTTFTNYFKPGQVLFGKRRAYQRKVALAEFEGVCSGDIYIFESKDPSILLPELLPFICQTEGFYEHAVGTSAGSLSPRTNWSHLAEYHCSLPPLSEQKRIAELLRATIKIGEQLFISVENFNRLEAATKYKIFSEASEKIRLAKLLEEGRLSYKTGPFGTVLQASSYVKKGIPVINPVNMIGGKVIINDGPFVNEKEAKRLDEYKIYENDLIFARKGDIGRGIFSTQEHEGYILGSDCIRVRVLDANINPKYLFYFLTSPTSRLLLNAQAHGTTMLGINEKMLSRMEVSIPNLGEQIYVTEVLEQLDEARTLLMVRIEKSKNLHKKTLQHTIG